MSEAEAERWAAAEAIASKTHPLSKITPLTGAFIGLCTAFFAAQMLTILTGIGRDTDPVWVLTFAIAFAGPFLYLRMAQRNHLAERKRAYDNLQPPAQETVQETIEETEQDTAKQADRVQTPSQLEE